MFPWKCLRQERGGAVEVGPGHSPQAREEEGLEKQLLEQGTPGAPHIHKKDQRECTRGMNIWIKGLGEGTD